MIANIPFLFDPLSIFFLFIIFVIALPTAIYSLGYLRAYARSRKTLGWALFIAFVAAMALVVTAGNAFTFLIAWEIMSLVSYFLVVFEREQERAAWIKYCR